MATVTSEIKNILKMKDSGMLSGTQAMRKLLTELQRDVLFGIHLGTDWDRYYLRKLLSSIEFQIANFDAKAKAELSGQLESMWGHGQNLVDLPLKTSGIYFGMPHIATSMLDTLGNKEFVFGKISGVASDAFTKIRGELTLGLMGGKTPAQVTAAIGQDLNHPSIFKSIAERAETITKTEMGRAFSMSTRLRMEEAGKYVPDLKRVWIHAGHPKVPRITHLIAHGQVVGYDEPFKVGGMDVKSPQDPGLPIKDVIHCNCIAIPYKESWKISPDKGYKLSKKMQQYKDELAA